MAFFVYRAQFLVDHMGIHLRGGDVAMPHQLLERTDVSAVFQKVYGEAVSKRMGSDLLLYPGFILVVL